MTLPNQAIEEIKAVLARHDLAGMIVVQDAGESAFLLKIDPSWSCAKWEQTPEGVGIRIKAKRSDYPSKEEQDKAVGATAGMILSFINQCDRNSEELGRLVEMLSRYIDIKHWETPS